MKRISIVCLLIFVGACSTHGVKCHSPLRPINVPTVSAPKHATGSPAATNPQPASGEKRGGSTEPFRTEPQP